MSLRRTLSIALVAVAVGAVLVLAALNYWQAREMLTTSVESALRAQQSSRADSVEDGLDRVRAEVAVVARDPGVIAATIEFAQAFELLDAAGGLLSPAEEEALRDWYEANATEVFRQVGLDPPEIDSLLPGSAAGRYLQYHYIVQNPFPDGDGADLVEPDGDTSEYASVHARRHETLKRYTNEYIRSLVLVDTEGRIVYSTAKQIDLGTSLESGPHRDTALALGVTRRLPAAPVGEPIIVDFERYLPDQGRPVLFSVASVQSDGKTVGAVALEVRSDALNAIAASGGRWEATGLGDTGETYVVGPDKMMRTDSRLWQEEPETYLELRDERIAEELTGDAATQEAQRQLFQLFGELIQVFDSTVLLQEVDTEPVDAALDGETFVGRAEDYLGRNTLTVASPIEAKEVNWVLIASVGVEEATGPLNSYTRRMLFALAILVPLVGVLGVLLADRMTRPIAPVADAAARVAEGEFTTRFPDLGRNEFGDLARRLDTLTADLAAQEEALEQEERATTELLLSALPPRLVRGIEARAKESGDLVDTATIVVLGIEGIVDQSGIDQDSAVDLSVYVSRTLENLAGELALERVRSASTQHIFAAGLAHPGTEANAAAEFALRSAAAVGELAEANGLELSLRAGMCGGEVVSGVLDTDQLTYGVFGRALRTALLLESVASSGDLLVCAETAEELGSAWDTAVVPDLMDLRGEPLDAVRLLGRREDRNNREG